MLKENVLFMTIAEYDNHKTKKKTEFKGWPPNHKIAPIRKELYAVDIYMYMFSFWKKNIGRICIQIIIEYSQE